jgi:hypothetical protein
MWHQAWQLYYVENLHLLGHPVTAALIKTVVKEIHCTLLKNAFLFYLWLYVKKWNILECSQLTVTLS